MSNFFRVSEACSIAIHAMILIANNQDRLVRTKEIAGSFNISEAHLAKVLNHLLKAGMVSAIRGPSGGYKLNRPAGKISLYDIYEVIEGKVQENRCMFSIPICDGTGCQIGDFFTSRSREVEEKLSRTKLSDISFKKEFNNK